MNKTMVKTIININLIVSEQIKTDLKISRIKKGTGLLFEDGLGQMVEDRFYLQKSLDKKGMTFEELMSFLNKSKS